MTVVKNITPLLRTFTLSTGKNRHAISWKHLSCTWDSFLQRLQEPERTEETMEAYAALSKDERAALKDNGGYVGGEVKDEGHRNHDSVQTRQLLTLDIDYGDESIWDVWESLYGYPAAMHSTHSHTPEHPRLRLIIPLARPVTAVEYEPIGRRVAEWLGIDAFDATTYESHRLMYWPSCPKDAPYVFHAIRGEDWMDPDMVLDSYADWRDMREWPQSTAEREKVRELRDHAKKQGDPLTKPGVIGAFNRAYRITDAIVNFLPGIYTPCGKNRWTYAAGSTVGGAVTYDNDTFLYSHHDTDPASGLLCSAFDLVRVHLYGALDKGHEKEDISLRPSMAKMRQFVAQDELVRDELASAIRQDPGDAFTKDTGLEHFGDDATEQGLAVAFADQYGHQIRYTGPFGWLFWDGSRWQIDAEPEVQMLALHFADERYGDALVAAKANPENKELKKLLSSAVKLRTATGQRHLLDQTRAIVYDGEPERYDADGWLLNTPGGLLDLRTGEMHPHDPDACCTKITTVSPAPAGEGGAMWQDFLRHITAGDVDFERYLQTMAGMAAIGDVYEEGLILSYGPGGNGKSTLFGALRRVLGDYAKAINADVLVSQQGRTDQTYVAALRGLRLAVLGETDEGARMSIGQMKRLTSRDSISARALYKDPIEFVPTHTLVMHTNHLPRLNSMDGGTRRRIAVAPFLATMAPEQIITDFERRLVDQDGPAILRWIVDGARRFYEAECKLQKSRNVLQATEDYIKDEDWLQQFLDARCVVDPNAAVTSSELYQIYVAHTQAEKAYVRCTRDFASALERKGFVRRRAARGMRWYGLRLKTEEDEV